MVIPCPPNCSQSRATCSKSGLLPPRALRNVANLLMFTLSLVIIAWYNEENTVILLNEAKNFLSQFMPRNYENVSNNARCTV